MPDCNSTCNTGIAQPATCFPGYVSGFPGSLELPLPWISKEKMVATCVGQCQSWLTSASPSMLRHTAAWFCKQYIAASVGSCCDHASSQESQLRHCISLGKAFHLLCLVWTLLAAPDSLLTCWAQWPDGGETCAVPCGAQCYTINVNGI